MNLFDKNRNEIDFPSKKFCEEIIKKDTDEIIIFRQGFLENKTIGNIIVKPLGKEGFPVCNSLEDRYRDLSIEKKIYGQTAIPEGVYAATNIWWSKYGIVTPYLFYVPQFEGIRIHSGTDEDDTFGCPLTGYSTATNFNKSGRVAFGELMKDVINWTWYKVKIIHQKVDN